MTTVELPRGTVTLLFSDIEGSTRLLQDAGEDEYGELLTEHRRLLRKAFASHKGTEVGTEGDSFFVAFGDAADAAAAAVAAQQALVEGPIRVRIGLHTTTPAVRDGNYVGLGVNTAARICSAAHGGQVLVSDATRALVEHGAAGLTLRDLGEHRLKDLSEPLRLYQVGDGDFPPPRTLYFTNLPVPPTAFVGRRAELDELGALLSAVDIRLVTLTGVGGTGKTRLALQAAAEVAEEYPDGIRWVPLASVRDPDLVMPAIAEAIGAKGDVHSHVEDKRMLLVLDNVEHLLEAANGLASLIAACPRLTLLVTSRETLHLMAEHEYPVEPLTDDDAAALFRERSRTEGGAEGEVDEICRRLDRLPLAIELAAARTKLLSPSALLRRLEQRLPLLTGGPRDAPERQQTLRATIAWSHDLLTPAEKPLFARFAVFVGGCTLEAAEAVADADLDTLESLIDRSLLRHARDRYWMLETIREYAAEELGQSGEADELRRRHAEYFVAFAGEAEDGWRGEEQPAWRERLAQEEPNLRATLAWLKETDDPDRVLAVVNGVRGFWDDKGNWLEGRRWVEPALAMTAGERTLRRGKALSDAVTFLRPLGEVEKAREYAEEALSLFRSLGDDAWIGRSLVQTGAMAYARGDIPETQRLFEEAVTHLAAAGDRANLAVVTGNLGALAIGQRDDERAVALLEEAVELYRELGHEHGLTGCLYNLAFLFFQAGRDEECASTLADTLQRSARIGDRVYGILGVFLMGSLAARRNASAEAARLLGAAEAERERTGLALTGAPEGKLIEETTARLRATVGDSEFETAFAEGRALGHDEAVTRALEFAPAVETSPAGRV